MSRIYACTFAFLMVSFSCYSEIAFALNPTFALSVVSWHQDYPVLLQIPSIMYDGAEVKVSMYAPSTSFFAATTHLVRGNCVSVGGTMERNDILAVPKYFKSNNVEFEYVRSEGNVVETINNMYDGKIGLVAINTTPNNCLDYLKIAASGEVDPNWYGSGKMISAIYKIKRLPEPGLHNLSLPVDSYFTRVSHGNHLGDLSYLSGYKNSRVVSSDYRVTAWCKVANKSIELDHKLMTPELVNGNFVSKNVTLECGGGGKGMAKLSLSNKMNKSTVNLGKNVLSEVKLSDTNVSIARDSSVNITISSTLIADPKEIKAGELVGSEVLTVEWL